MNATKILRIYQWQKCWRDFELKMILQYHMASQVFIMKDFWQLSLFSFTRQYFWELSDILSTFEHRFPFKDWRHWVHIECCKWQYSAAPQRFRPKWDRFISSDFVNDKYWRFVAVPWFPRGDANPKGVANLVFDYFSENCMKMNKKLAGRDVPCAPPTPDPPIEITALLKFITCLWLMQFFGTLMSRINRYN